MRLRDYQYLLNKNMQKIHNLKMTDVPGRPQEKKLSNIQEFYKAIKAFANAGLFKEQVKYFNSYNFLLPKDDDHIFIKNAESGAFLNALNLLKQGITNLSGIINTILPEEDSTLIHIKLPKIESLKKLKEFFDDLDNSLFVFQYLGEESKVKGFDTGSEWLVIAIASVPLIYTIADKALCLRNTWLEGNLTIAKIESTKVGKTDDEVKIVEKTIEFVKESNAEELKKLKELYASEIIQETPIEIPKGRNEGELKTHLSRSIHYMGKLIDLGMKMQPAFNTTEEIQTLTTVINEKIEKRQNAILGISETKLITDETNNSTQNELIKENGVCKENNND